MCFLLHLFLFIQFFHVCFCIYIGHAILFTDICLDNFEKYFKEIKKQLYYLTEILSDPTPLFPYCLLRFCFVEKLLLLIQTYKALNSSLMQKNNNNS